MHVCIIYTIITQFTKYYYNALLFQTAILVCQSIVLGLLTDYFSIEAPTSEDTRSAYLNALGKQIEPFREFLVCYVCMYMHIDL